MAVVDAVEGRLADLWPDEPVVGVNGRNTPPADGANYLLVEYPLAEEPVMLTEGAPGQNYWREEGAFRLVLHRPRAAGIRPGLIEAEELSALFLGKDLGNGVQTFAPTSPAIDDRNTLGNYVRFSIAVPYQADFIG
jgi:hypothetical protein